MDDNTLFADIENVINSSAFQVNGDEVISAVEGAFDTTKVCVERMADEFLSKLQKHPEFDLFFKEQADNFAKMKSDCISDWKRELSLTEQIVAQKIIVYFDSKLTQHSHRVINIKNAMSGKVMRLRESVIQYRIGHELKSEERIREHKRLIVDILKSEKDTEIAELKAVVANLEGQLHTAQQTRLTDPSYLNQLTNHNFALERARKNMGDEPPTESLSKSDIVDLVVEVQEPICDKCPGLQSRIDALERAAAAGRRKSNSVGKNRIVRPSQIVMNHRNTKSPYGSDDDDDESIASTVDSAASPIVSISEGNRSPARDASKANLNAHKMGRVSMIKDSSGAAGVGGGHHRGRQRSEITPITRSGPGVASTTGIAASITGRHKAGACEQLKEEDEDDEDDDSNEGVTNPIPAATSTISVTASSPALPVQKQEMDTQQPEPMCVQVTEVVPDTIPVSTSDSFQPADKPTKQSVSSSKSKEVKKEEEHHNIHSETPSDAPSYSKAESVATTNPDFMTVTSAVSGAVPDDPTTATLTTTGSAETEVGANSAAITPTTATTATTAVIATPTPAKRVTGRVARSSIVHRRSSSGSNNGGSGRGSPAGSRPSSPLVTVTTDTTPTATTTATADDMSSGQPMGTVAISHLKNIASYGIQSGVSSAHSTPPSSAPSSRPHSGGTGRSKHKKEGQESDHKDGHSKDQHYTAAAIDGDVTPSADSGDSGIDMPTHADHHTKHTHHQHSKLHHKKHHKRASVVVVQHSIECQTEPIDLTALEETVGRVGAVVVEEACSQTDTVTQHDMNCQTDIEETDVVGVVNQDSVTSPMVKTTATINSVFPSSSAHTATFTATKSGVAKVAAFSPRNTNATTTGVSTTVVGINNGGNSTGADASPIAEAAVSYNSPDPFVSPKEDKDQQHEYYGQNTHQQNRDRLFLLDEEDGSGVEEEQSLPSAIEVTMSRKNSTEEWAMEEHDREQVHRLEDNVKNLNIKLIEAEKLYEALQLDCSTLREKLRYSEDLNMNQGMLFNLKLKERSLLLKELSNQVNIMRSEAARRDNIEQTRRARITPVLSVPLSEARNISSSRGRGDITGDGTSKHIQPIPVISRRDSAPGLTATTQKDPYTLKLDNRDFDAPRPRTANAPTNLSAYSYNTPATTLLREAYPISTRIRQGKVGGFTGGMNSSKSVTKLKSPKPIPHLQNTASALRDACNLPSDNKLDMFSSSGGKFGRVGDRSGPGPIPSKTVAAPHSNDGDGNDIFIEKRDDILVSAHDEIVDIRLKIGELLREHELINQKRQNISKPPGSAAGKRPSSQSGNSTGRAGTAPGRQRVRSPSKSRPTSPPMLEKFMQFERLTS